MFTGGRWFRLQRECKDLDRDQILEGQLQWFIYIVRYLQFVTGETVSTLESQMDKVHATKVSKTKKQYIVISAFKTDIAPILGGFGEGQEIFTTMTAIRIPYLWNANYGVKGVYPRASKCLHDKIIKLQDGINQEFQIHKEAIIMASKIFIKFGVFW